MKNQELMALSQNTQQSIISGELISEGKWVKLEKKTIHMDPTGTARSWDTVKCKPGKDGQLVAWGGSMGAKD
ncbi:ADP-sugar pyrophosphatase [Vulpes lagopus]